MRAAVLTGIGQVRIEDRPEPTAPPGWVVVRVESASLCGTDSHQFDGRIDTPFPGCRATTSPAGWTASAMASTRR